MTIDNKQESLPSADSPHLHLAHATDDERIQICTDCFPEWGDWFELPEFLAESRALLSIPLARDQGLTSWVLVDKRLPPDQRTVLASCESYYKRALRSNSEGEVEEVIIHGIASVFVAKEYRRRGYAARHMREVGRILRDWQQQSDKHGTKPVVGSILYSDIGRQYYAKLGWAPHPTNTHLDFRPMPSQSDDAPGVAARAILPSELAGLCQRDEAIVRKAMATPAPGVEERVVVMPDLDHMLWHIGKEEFATSHLFNKVADAKGAIAGPPGKQVWAIWTRRYYGRPDAKEKDAAAAAKNVLYILRLVVEGDPSANRPRSLSSSSSSSSSEEDLASLPDDQVGYLQAVLRAAQNEAAEWKLDHVRLWEPSPCVMRALAASSSSSSSAIEYTVVEREKNSIASAMWYGPDGQEARVPPPVWIDNEYYAWC